MLSTDFLVAFCLLLFLWTSTESLETSLSPNEKSLLEDVDRMATVKSSNKDSSSLKQVNQIDIKILDQVSENAVDLNHYLSSRSLDKANGEDSLKAKFKPAPINGPVHLIDQLNGKCFDFLDKNYKWVVCPFANVTQYEQSVRWNPYKGILGIWYEWNISEENKFESMRMLNGDDCGNEHGNRESELSFVCNPSQNQKTEIESVNELKTCSYQIVIKTPFVCSREDLKESLLDRDQTIYWSDLMFVYPYLNETLKQNWNQLFTDYKMELITEKYYDIARNSIFIQAGFKRSSHDLESLRLVDEQQGKNNEVVETNNQTNNQSGDLENCLKDNENLKNELRELRKEVSHLRRQRIGLDTTTI